MPLSRSITLLTASILVTPLAAQTPSAAVPPSSAQAVMSDQAATTVDLFHQALQRGDLTAASSLIASDALIYESGGVERSKAEYAAHHLSADAAFASATKRTVTRRSNHLSGDLAWVATESTTGGTYKGRAISSKSTETMILRREGSAWLIAHIHWSSANVN